MQNAQGKMHKADPSRVCLESWEHATTPSWFGVTGAQIQPDLSFT